MRSRSLKALRFKLLTNFPNEAMKCWKKLEADTYQCASMKAKNPSLQNLKWAIVKMRLGSSKIIWYWVLPRRQQSPDRGLLAGRYHLWRRTSLSSWSYSNLTFRQRVIVALRVEMWRSHSNISHHQIIDINSRSKSGKSSLRHYNNQTFKDCSHQLMPCHHISHIQPLLHHTHRGQMTIT